MNINVVRAQQNNVKPVSLSMKYGIEKAKLNKFELMIICSTFKQFDESSALRHAILAEYLIPLKKDRHCEINGVKVSLLNKQRIHSQLDHFTGVIVSLWPSEITAKEIILSAPNAEEFIFVEWSTNSLQAILDEYSAKLIPAT